MVSVAVNGEELVGKTFSIIFAVVASFCYFCWRSDVLALMNAMTVFDCSVGVC